MKHTRSALAIAVANALIGPALAADGATEPATPASAPESAVRRSARDVTAAGLEEIVVTATRRETRLQDTPIAITALSAEQLEAYNVQDVSNLAQVVPGLQIRDNSTDGQGSVDINIRGIG